MTKSEHRPTRRDATETMTTHCQSQNRISSKQLLLILGISISRYLYGCVRACVRKCCVCVSGQKVLAQRIQYSDYTIWTTHQGTESRITTFDYDDFSGWGTHCTRLCVGKHALVLAFVWLYVHTCLIWLF